MKLISCHVENFGGLQDFDYVFSDGVNIVCRENGWGKSTFAAFLLAMFYGLPSKGKKRQADSLGNRLSLQDARNVYRPWQGGVFGGRIIFEAGGRTYEMTRVFGDRESEDDFDLRDPDTNLPCFDYTKNIGREMFAIDRESFLRTVFTSQQDCLTRPTDDVNALIADLAEHAGDMESYEAAQRRLKERANRLTPKRSTGRLCRIQERIGLLERETAASMDLEEGIASCGREQEEVGERIKALEAEGALLGKEIAAAEQIEEEAAGAERETRSLLAKKQIWQQLSGTEQRRRRALEEASAFFPGRIPTRSEADTLLGNCREMERLEERMRAEMLTEDEQERLTLLEERFGSSAGSDAVYDHYKKNAEEKREKRRKTESRKKAPLTEKRVLLSAVGILLIAAAIILAIPASRALFAGRVPAPLMTGAALILAAAGAGIATAAALHREAAPDLVRAEGSIESREKSDEERSRAYAEYLDLERKEQKLEETHADWAEARKPILLFLRELGFPPSKDLHAQLTAIRDAADDCEDAGALLRESEEELRDFETELRRAGLTVEKVQHARLTADRMGMQNRQSTAELRMRREQVHEELLRCRSQAADTERRMEELSLERDETDIMLEELKSLREQQQTDMEEYRHVVTASALLRKAKESLTSRYADPIRTGFCKYWEMITGDSAAGVYVDAASNVTIEREGMQRDAAALSTGWRDLTGICLRAALADAMYPPERGERPPLILDDPFTNLDDGMMEGAMHFLRETGRNYQILYFTCSSSRC